FARGYEVFEQTGSTPLEAYLALRQLYCLTDGRFNDRATALLEQEFPPSPPADPSGVLGTLGPQPLADFSARLERDGFVVFDARLDPDRCARLRRLALET